jgi:hypothetical protein
MKEVRREGNWLWTYEDFGRDGCAAQLFYRHPDHGWRPPLPPDLELPEETTRPANFTTGIERSQP